MTADRPKRTTHPPIAIVLSVAIFGLLAMLIFDHGPWNRPDVKSAEVASYATTGAAARAAGATVTQTAPRPALEPAAPGPKPAQPANPTQAPAPQGSARP